MTLPPTAMVLFEGGRLISLTLPDVLIIVLYFAMVLGIGIYLKPLRRTPQTTSSWPAAI